MAQGQPALDWVLGSPTSQSGKSDFPAGGTALDWVMGGPSEPSPASRFDVPDIGAQSVAQGATPGEMPSGRVAPEDFGQAQMPRPDPVNAGIEDVVRGAELGTGRMVKFGGQMLQRGSTALQDAFGSEKTRAEKAREVGRAGKLGDAITEQGLTHPAPTSLPGEILQGAGGIAPILAGSAINPALGAAALGAQMGSGVEDAYDATLKATGNEALATERAVAEVPLQALYLAPLGRILMGAGPEGATLIRKGLDGLISGALGPGAARVLGEVASEKIDKQDQADLGAALKRGLAAGGHDALVNAPLFAFLSAMSGEKAPAEKPLEAVQSGPEAPKAVETPGQEPTQLGEAPPPEAAPPVTLGQPAKEPLGTGVEAPAETKAPSQEPAVPSQPVPGEARPSDGPKSPTSTKNAVVDQEREARGLAPAMQSAAREFGPVWDEATKKIDENPGIGDQLVEELKAKPRALTDTENAILLQKQIELQNEHGRVQRDLLSAAEGGDTARVAELQARNANLSDKLLDVYNVGKSAGTETGRGLNARRMMANEDFSLAAMETAKRVANQGKPLTEEQSGWVRDLYTRVAAAEKAIEEFQAQGPRGLPKPSRQTGKVLEFISAQADAARARIKARGPRAMALGDPVAMADHVIIGAELLAKDIRAFSDWSAKMLGEFGEAIKPHLQDIYARAQDFLSSTPKKVGAMQSRETRAANQIAHYQSLIDAGDFEPAQKKTPEPPSPKLRELQAQFERVKGEYRTGLLKDQMAARSMPEKVMDTLAKWRRGFLLSSPNTLAKLTSAAFERIGIAPVEEAIGAGISKLAPGLAERAPSEGGASVKIEAHAITEGFTQGMRDAAKTLKTGKSDLDVLNGKKLAEMPRDVSDFLGAIHGALKAPVKRAAFTRSFEKRTAWAIKNGLDVTDPMVQGRIALDAYKDANRSVFMQDNRLVDAYKRGLQALEAKNKATGKPSLLGKSAATVAKVMLPIVKIPTNIAAETAQYALGSVYGAGKLAHAYAKGIESLSPYEADSIMRSLKKGSIGAAGLALGYFGANQVGGYYQPGKRDKKDVDFGSVRVFGHDIPSMLIHNPLLETLQIGATIRRVADSKLRKKDDETQGVGAGTMAAALGLLEEVPFAREAAEAGKVLAGRPDERQRALGNFASGMVVPAGVSWLARQIDRDKSGDEIKRDAKTVVEHIQEGIPVLRSKLPAKVEKPESSPAIPGLPRLRGMGGMRR